MRISSVISILTIVSFVLITGIAIVLLPSEAAAQTSEEVYCCIDGKAEKMSYQQCRSRGARHFPSYLTHEGPAPMPQNGLLLRERGTQTAHQQGVRGGKGRVFLP